MGFLLPSMTFFYIFNAYAWENELASALLFSSGGLSRLLDRLESAGLVARERTPDDRRGVYAVLTEAGFTRLQQASKTHLHGVQQHFIKALYDEEREPVAQFLARLLSINSDTLESGDES